MFFTRVPLLLPAESRLSLLYRLSELASANVVGFLRQSPCGGKHCNDELLTCIIYIGRSVLPIKRREYYGDILQSGYAFL